MKTIPASALAALLTLGGLLATAGAQQPNIRIGMIGLDTSHVTAIAGALNHPEAKGHVPGATVVCGVRAGSPDVAYSRDRIDRFTAELRDKDGVRIVDTIPELLAQCDAVMIMSVDGRPHLEEARAIFGHGKPVFIDKPLAATLADAKAIVELGRKTHTPFFSCSGFRFSSDLNEALADRSLGEIRGAVAYGNGETIPQEGTLFYEGIHAVETLYMALGPDCQSVRCVNTPDSVSAIGVWPSERLGVLYDVRNGRTPHEITIFGRKKVQVVNFDAHHGYNSLTAAIVRFFQTGVAPVKPEQTLQIIAFLEAAGRSEHLNGAPVEIERP